jgi:hypothetical protein
VRRTARADARRCASYDGCVPADRTRTLSGYPATPTVRLRRQLWVLHRRLVRNGAPGRARLHRYRSGGARDVPFRGPLCAELSGSSRWIRRRRVGRRSAVVEREGRNDRLFLQRHHTIANGAVAAAALGSDRAMRHGLRLPRRHQLRQRRLQPVAKRELGGRINRSGSDVAGRSIRCTNRRVECARITTSRRGCGACRS